VRVIGVLVIHLCELRIFLVGSPSLGGNFSEIDVKRYGRTTYRREWPLQGVKPFTAGFYTLKKALFEAKIFFEAMKEGGCKKQVKNPACQPALKMVQSASMNPR
jgi:hypothetical protein